VHFLGFFETPADELLVCTEYVPGGTLRNLLRKYSSPLTSLTLIKLALSAAQGMDFLSTWHIPHQDLTTQNILLTGEGETNVKIADFGITRLTEFYHTSLKRINRYSAPEVIQFDKYSLKSDVWAFGILLWEMFEAGKEPYSGKTNEEVIEFVLNGGHLICPASTPYNISELALKCWQWKPENRPSFNEIVIVLSEPISKEKDQVIHKDEPS